MKYTLSETLYKKNIIAQANYYFRSSWDFNWNSKKVKRDIELKLLINNKNKAEIYASL